MRARFHVEQGEPNADGEHEWNVLDRSQTHPNCEGCTGVCVATYTNRRSARTDARSRNAAVGPTRFHTWLAAVEKHAEGKADGETS